VDSGHCRDGLGDFHRSVTIVLRIIADAKGLFRSLLASLFSALDKIVYSGSKVINVA